MLSSPSSLESKATRLPSSTGDVLRSRNAKKDNAIRAKADQELKRKPSFRKTDIAAPSRVRPGTVASLRPLPPILVPESAFVSQAAMLMATKKADAVLVVDGNGSLCGILTDKDVAYRLVAEGLDARTTLVSQIMTPNPTAVNEADNRSDALSIMTQRKFRHLPVLSCQTFEGDGVPENNVMGLLDITKCVFERLGDLEKRVVDDEHVIHAMESMEKHGTIDTSFAQNMKKSHGCPDLHSVLQHDNQIQGYPASSMKSTVRDATKIMKAYHSTGVLILDDNEKLVGIFTTKDVVLRVIASGLEPATTTVVRVMTHNPDSVDVNTTLLDALKRMHAFHYLHLPVTDGESVCGLVDVQQLTMAMLGYLIDKAVGESGEGGSGVAPWSNFWNQTLASQNDSFVSGSLASPSHRSVSEFDRDSVRESVNEPVLAGLMLERKEIVKEEARGVLSIKIKDSVNGRVFRLNHRVETGEQLLILIKDKLGVDELAGLWYEDDEGDCVDIESEEDLVSALEGCERMKTSRLVLEYGEKRVRVRRVEVAENMKSGVTVGGVSVAKLVVGSGLLLLTSFVIVRIFKQ